MECGICLEPGATKPVSLGKEPTWVHPECFENQRRMWERFPDFILPVTEVA